MAAPKPIVESTLGFVGSNGKTVLPSVKGPRGYQKADGRKRGLKLTMPIGLPDSGNLPNLIRAACQLGYYHRVPALCHIADGNKVKISIPGKKPGTFKDVLVRPDLDTRIKAMGELGRMSGVLRIEGNLMLDTVDGFLRRMAAEEEQESEPDGTP